MRVDCRNYESRTYESGETVRMCRIGAAPEAPWRCPTDCPYYVKKLSGGGWVHGSLEHTPAPEEPPELDEGARSILDEAQGIVNSIGPDVVAEVEQARQAEQEEQRRQASRRWWWPFGG